MPGVAFGVVLARVPGGVNRIDLDEAALQAGIVTDRIEDEEFVFRTEERGVGNTRRLQIFLGALGKRTRVTAVALAGGRLDDIAGNHQRRIVEERDRKSTRLNSSH